MKKYVYKGILLLLAGLMFTGFNEASIQARSKETLVVAHNPLPFNLPSLIEQEHGFLKKEGFEVVYQSFGTGYAMTEAMVAGNLDVAPAMGATSTIISKAAGRDIKVIGCYSQAPGAFALVTRPGTVKQNTLKGKTVAVPLGTELHVLLGKILVEQGLNLRDIKLVNLSVPDGITALQSGQVDGVMVVEPLLSRFVSQGALEVLRDGEGLISGMTLSVIPRDLLGSKKEAAFQRAHNQCVAYLRENYEDTLNLAETKLGLPKELVRVMGEKYSFESELTQKQWLELEETMEFLYTEGIIRKPFPLEDLF